VRKYYFSLYVVYNLALRQINNVVDQLWTIICCRVSLVESHQERNSFFYFRWLAKDEDDGQIIRELTLGGTSLLQSKSNTG
jgi:hypothetical protein